MTILAKLLAKETDPMGYITYVFECLDDEIIKEIKYIMCIQFPKWDQRSIEIDEIGFLTVFEIRAGVDKWFDGNQFIPYRYNNIQFIKFIKKPIKTHYKYILLIHF